MQKYFLKCSFPVPSPQPQRQWDRVETNERDRWVRCVGVEGVGELVVERKGRTDGLSVVTKYLGDWGRYGRGGVTVGELDVG
jgi:hypothetical protein